MGAVVTIRVPDNTDLSQVETRIRESLQQFGEPVQVVINKIDRQPANTYMNYGRQNWTNSPGYTNG